MSSIRSASSRTRIRTRLRSTSLRCARSSSRPGVAIRIWAFGTALPCSPMLTPPYASATRSPLARAMSSVSSATCDASSRVGTRTRAAGFASSGLMRSTIGIAKPSVLPEPVCDFARTSWPSIALGSTSDWIANGTRMSRSARASITAVDTPSSGKVLWVIRVLLRAERRASIVEEALSPERRRCAKGYGGRTSRAGAYRPCHPCYQRFSTVPAGS